jgi:ribonuclease HI
LKTFGDEA